MVDVWKKHVFTVELPYEKDQVVTEFLKKRFMKVDVFIMSLGQMTNLPPSKLFSFINGRQVEKTIYTKNNYNASGMKLYFLYIPKALFFVIYDLFRALKQIHFSCDIFFAQHFLPAYVAILLRKAKILKCEKIIFWMFDFFPVPSEFPRGLYYRGMDSIQKYVRKNVDEIWYTTPRLLECDKERFGELPPNVTKRLTEGCFFQRFNTPKAQKSPPLRLAFLGSLRHDTAIYESINVVDTCKKRGMIVELLVIGSGPEEKYVKQYVQKIGLVKEVIFYGYKDKGEEIAKILSKCHLGLALYPANPYSPNWYLTSGKFRRYISQGLPVVASTVPYFTKYIYDYNAGMIVNTDPNDAHQALEKIYHNSTLLEKMRTGVDRLYKKYKANNILNQAFSNMLYSKPI